MLDAALERAEALIRVGVGRSGQRVAVKVLKSGAGFSQAGQDETALLRCVSGCCLPSLTSHFLQMPQFSLQLLDPISPPFSPFNMQTLKHNLLLPVFFLPSSHLSNVPPQASGPATRHPAIVQLVDEFKVVGVNGVHIPFRNCLSLQKVSLLWSDEELLAGKLGNMTLIPADQTYVWFWSCWDPI